jgi:hypothetical protein
LIVEDQGLAYIGTADHIDHDEGDRPVGQFPASVADHVDGGWVKYQNRLRSVEKMAAISNDISLRLPSWLRHSCCFPRRKGSPLAVGAEIT